MWVLTEVQLGGRAAGLSERMCLQLTLPLITCNQQEGLPQFLSAVLLCENSPGKAGRGILSLFLGSTATAFMINSLYTEENC